MRVYNKDMTYTEEQIATYCELAQEIGVGRAKRELGYPKSWDTGRTWCENRSVTVAVDELKAKAAATRDWYKDEEVKLAAQDGMAWVHEQLATRTDLTPDDGKKLSEALYKFYNTWASVQGKAANISESRTKDLTLSPELVAMWDEVDRENKLFESEDKPSISV